MKETPLQIGHICLNFFLDLEARPRYIQIVAAVRGHSCGASPTAETSSYAPFTYMYKDLLRFLLLCLAVAVIAMLGALVSAATTID